MKFKGTVNAVQLLGASISLLVSKSASACPLCHSETGELVRAGIFNEEFWGNVLLGVLPFPILAALVALIYYRWPNPYQTENPHG